jgi:hypothetical protein
MAAANEPVAMPDAAANLFASDDQFLDGENPMGASQVSQQSNVNRDSGISVSRFNKWVVTELKQDVGRDVRLDAQQLRSLRKDAQDSHRQYGASLGAASRAQMLRDKKQYEALRRANWHKGSQVREDVTAQKSEAERLRAEWIEHGRRLAQQDADQRRKIREVCGEGSRRVTELVAQCKLEEEMFEAELKAKREAIMEGNRQEVQKVRSETADAVIEASKQYALERRRGIASATKSAMAMWKRERSANTADHLRTARTNRADAQASRAQAKKLREQLVAQRKKEALEQRSALKAAREAKERQREKIGGSIKTNHDDMYHAKFVPADSAELFEKASIAHLVA